MQLEIRPPEHMVPSYSLTGDLLSYSRCRLQYRYHNGSALPPSRPVQLWFGEFLHGSLEMCYRYWREQLHLPEGAPPFPWPCTPHERGETLPIWDENDIGRFGNSVEERLARQGKQARSSAARNSAYSRLTATINELCPNLFPLIADAEKRVIGTRSVPASSLELRCDNYEVHGAIDVLTHFTLASVHQDNPVRRSIEAVCPTLEPQFEVIVDYKGTSRPLTSDPEWDLGNWQIQTYAWLRGQQPDSLSIPAGILVYINELVPGHEEVRKLRRGLADDTTDVRPEAGSRDERIARMWGPGEDANQLSLEYRLQRAIRVVPITNESITIALDNFDNIVRKIEEDIVHEAEGSDILESWSPNCKDGATCVACDFRYFCPDPCGHEGPYPTSSPVA